MNTDLPICQTQLLQLANDASQIVLDAGRFLADTALTRVTQKSGHANFVTDMDFKVQERLVALLTPLVPAAAFLLEEGDEKPDISQYTWIIDPIDGTQNFINQYRMSAIAVGFVCGQTGLLGIVYNPFLEELFLAVRGQGATLNGKPIHASHKPINEAIVSFGTSPYYEELHQKSAAAISRLYPLCADFRRTGSAALDLCYVACGRQDGYFEYRLCPWDYAGASIILREAGGTVCQIGQTDWDYTRTTGILAGNAANFDSLREIIDGDAGKKPAPPL